MLELYYNFVTIFCDVNKIEDSEMDTDPLYLALAEKELEDCAEIKTKSSGNDCDQKQKISATVSLLMHPEIVML